LIDLLGLPSETGCGFVTGATVANITALAAARHAVLARVVWNVEARGLFGAPPITVIVGAEVHPTVKKSLGVLNEVLVSFGDAARTNRIIARVQEDGTCWCGGTVWQGKTAMRISVCSWKTTDADVEKSLAAILRCAAD
jgi:hypothetical protein